MDRREYFEASIQTEPEIQDGAIDQQAPIEQPKKAKDISWMLENAKLNRVVWSATVDAIPQSANHVSSKEAAELLCSYSWKRTPIPTIYVPGTPAIFTSPHFVVVGQKDGIEVTEPIQLPEDSGYHWVD